VHKIKGFFLLILVMAIGQSQGQMPTGLGLQFHYNYAIQGMGAGLRYEIPLSSTMAVVPQAKYQPAGFNSIHEVYAGLAVHYSPLQSNSAKFYLLGAVDLNQWFNYFPSLNSRASRFNVLPKPGAGLEIGFGSMALFSEVKYNILWKESYTDFGLKFRGDVSRKKRKNPQLQCPKIL
jgi:hypothetical protein